MNQELPFETELYTAANAAWPKRGKHILASVKNETVIVYQAYKPSIAKWVNTNQTFKGCPGYSMERMTWVKPNFLWMMYRSGWASKVNQERILAICVKEDGFKKLLELCKKRGDGIPSVDKEEKVFGDDDVRLQWDPDHDPHGGKMERRAIQLGIRGVALQKFVEEWIVGVSDITDFVKMQYAHVQNNELDQLRVPAERVYDLSDVSLRENIELDDFKE